MIDELYKTTFADAGTLPAPSPAFAQLRPIAPRGQLTALQQLTSNNWRACSSLAKVMWAHIVPVPHVQLCGCTAQADLVIVYARTDPGKGSKGITAFLVERGAPGFEQGAPIDLVGMRCGAVAPLQFDNCRVRETAPFS
jgi:hypothetical protein